MKIRPAALDKIASYICGDSPLPFPYRSSSRLTSFFTGLDLDYIHRGETRNTWTRDAIIEISRSKHSVGGFANADDALVAIIEEVVNPEYFEGDDSCNLVDAISVMNQTLRPYQFEIALDETNWTTSLVSTDGTFVSTAHRSPNRVTKITFSPRVFEVPETIQTRPDLVAVMMPFGGFDKVHFSIRAACENAGLELIRADDIWDNSTILQDIFDLIYTAEIVISDFTGRNPNVMYETGVAHTLGKHVIPITQNIEHVPSNLHGHRALVYVGANGEGLTQLEDDLFKRLTTLTSGRSWNKTAVPR